MKKLLLLASCLLILSGCNYQMVDLQYSFKCADMSFDGGQTWDYYDIKLWKDYEDGDQLQITMPNNNVLLIDTRYCILMESCPTGDAQYVKIVDPVWSI